MAIPRHHRRPLIRPAPKSPARAWRPLGNACWSTLGLQQLPVTDVLGLIIPHPLRFVGGRGRSAKRHGAPYLALLRAQRCSGKVRSGGPILLPRQITPPKTAVMFRVACPSCANGRVADQEMLWTETVPAVLNSTESVSRTMNPDRVEQFSRKIHRFNLINKYLGPSLTNRLRDD